jgi:hypothetical protein
MPNLLGQNFVDGFVDGVLGDETDDLIGYLAVFEEQQGWDAADAVAHWRGGVGVDIHLHDFELAMILIRNLIDDGGQSATRTAPCGPKIDQYGFSRLENIFFKVGIVYFRDVQTCHLTSSRLLYPLYTHVG